VRRVTPKIRTTNPPAKRVGSSVLARGHDKERPVSDPDDPDDSFRRQRQQQRRLWLQVLAFAAVYLIWGSTYLGIRVAVRTLPPFLMAGCRFLAAGSILYAVLRAALRVPAPTLAEWKHAAVAGAL